MLFLAKSLLQSTFSALSDFLWPRTCIFCLNSCEHGFSLFCKSCFLELSLVTPFDRCRFCFHPLPHDDGQRTIPPHKCIPHGLLIERIAFCLERSPVAEKFLSYCVAEISRGRRKRISKTVASLLTLQAHKLKLPACDAVILFSPQVAYSQESQKITAEEKSPSLFHEKQLLREYIQINSTDLGGLIDGYFVDKKGKMRSLSSGIYGNDQPQHTIKKKYTALILTETIPYIQSASTQLFLSALIEKGFTSFYFLSLLEAKS